jgi:hypothetical protein
LPDISFTSFILLLVDTLLPDVSVTLRLFNKLLKIRSTNTLDGLFCALLSRVVIEEGKMFEELSTLSDISDILLVET